MSLLLDLRVSQEALLEAVDHLGTPELDRFVSEVLALQARRRAPALPAEEAELVAQINRGLPAEVRERMAVLDERREREELTEEEHAELLRLVTEVEAAEARRVESLSRLARVRGVSLAALMGELGIKPPTHG